MNLNDGIRHTILQAVLDARFKKTTEALKSEREALALKIYTSVFGKQNVRRINALPEKWVQGTTYLSVRIMGQTHEFRFTKPIRRPYDQEPYTLTDPDLTAAYKDLLHRTELHTSQLASARSQAHAVLKSCRTVERLLKAWPEVKKFVPKEITPFTTALAIPIASLNQLLGLK